MHYVKILAVSSAAVVISTVSMLDAARGDTSVPIHTRPLATIEHDYGQAGAEIYWESEAAKGGAQETASGSDVSVGTAPPVQRDLGWFGRAGGYEGSDRVEREGDLGHSFSAVSQPLKAHAETGFGRAGGPVSPTDSN